MPHLKELLSMGPVEVTFVKADGSVRTMNATTNGEIIQSRLPPAQPLDENKVKRVYPENVFRVLDLDKNEFRSFREDRLIGWSSDFVNTGE